MASIENRSDPNARIEWEDFHYEYIETDWFDWEDGRREKTVKAMQHLCEAMP